MNSEESKLTKAKSSSFQLIWFFQSHLVRPFSSHKTTQPIVHLTEEEIDNILTCYTTMMYTMSTFEDWRVNLAQLLQSVPFPDQAQTNQKFIK